MSSRRPTILIRADGSPEIGTGHIMRCLSLAQGWQHAGGDCHFAFTSVTPALEQRLRDAGIAFTHLAAPAGGDADADSTAAYAQQLGAAWIVADGYRFGSTYQRRIKAAGQRLLLLDDYGHADSYCADLVLNQNLSARADWYANRESTTALLLGTRYALLREQFLVYRDWKREIPVVARKVLVTLGGTDPDNFTGKVVEALSGLDVDLKVVVGGSSPHYASLSAAVHSPNTVIRDASDMPAFMSWADVAIVAGGSTSWEAAFMGLPSLVLVLAENQRAVAASLDSAGIAPRTTVDRIASDLALLLSSLERRRAASERGQQLVDGSGVERVVTALRATCLTIRRAREDDCRLIWNWANDPDVRSNSFNSNPIPWEVHQQWFADKLTGHYSAIYIGCNKSGQPIGQVRFDWTVQGEARIGVSVDRAFRNAGWGSVLIRRATDEAFRVAPIMTIHAYVKAKNAASVRSFLKAGFFRVGTATIHDHSAVHLRLERNDE